MLAFLSMTNGESLRQILEKFAPDQSGAIWINILVWFLVAGDHERLLSRRNAALALLVVPALLMVDIMLWEPLLADPDRGWILGTVFTTLWLVTAGMMVWALHMAVSPSRLRWTTNLSTRALKVLFVLITVVNLTVILGRKPEDAGYYINLGTSRWIETGTMPYGDRALIGGESPGGGAASAYGPVLYAAHVPFQFLLGADHNPPELDPRDPSYRKPPKLASQLPCLLFYWLGLLALFRMGKRLAGTDFGLGVAVLYASSACVQGVGSDQYYIGGLTFISHMAPIAIVLLSLSFSAVPFVAGFLLSTAAFMLFYPVLFAPALCGWYFWRKRGLVPFLAGYAAAAVAVLGMVYVCTDSIGDYGPIELFLRNIIAHQEGSGSGDYGTSRFGFWGTHPELAQMFQTPLFGETGLFKPTFLMVAGLSVATFFLAKGRSVVRVALLMAGVGAATQLWKTHGGGTYVTFYLPLLIFGLVSRDYDEVQSHGTR